MAVYVIVGLVVLAGLILAYRTLGGAASTPIDSSALLRSVLAATGAAAADVGTLAGAPPPLGAGSPSAASTARALRRRITGLAQQLELVDQHALDDREAGAHALLVVALDELGSAAGMCAADAYASSDGMRAAVDALRDHASHCLLDASAMLKESAAAEEVERTP